MTKLINLYKASLFYKYITNRSHKGKNITSMNTKDLIVRVADGKDDLEKAAIGFYGYGFLFKDFKNSNESFVVASQSSKVCEMGAYLGITERVLQLDKVESLDELVRYEEKYDCLYGGALKTLLPTLKFGGDEILFYVWMFVRTPDGKQFPATFYFGPSGTSLGGWSLEKYESVFPKKFLSIINCSPFEFTKDQKEGLIEALECALKKVPVSDYYGVYHHDGGNALMGVNVGVPFIIELGYDYDETDVEFYLEEVEYFKDKFEEVYKR